MNILLDSLKTAGCTLMIFCCCRCAQNWIITLQCVFQPSVTHVGFNSGFTIGSVIANAVSIGKQQHDEPGYHHAHKIRRSVLQELASGFGTSDIGCRVAIRRIHFRIRECQHQFQHFRRQFH